MSEVPRRRKLSTDDSEYVRYIITELNRWEDQARNKLTEDKVLQDLFDGPYSSIDRLRDMIDLLERTLGKYLPPERPIK